MIGLGVGIDYALFIVTRYREGFTHGLDRSRTPSSRRSTPAVGPCCSPASPSSSRCSDCSSWVWRSCSGLAIGAVVGVLMMVLASLTLLPALLAMAGTASTTRLARRSRGGCDHRRQCDRLRHHRAPAIFCRRAPRPRRLSPAASRIKSLREPDSAPHRGAARAEVLVPLEPVRPAPAVADPRRCRRVPRPVDVPLFGIRLGFGDTGNLPERQTVRRAYDLLAEGFGPGIGGPLDHHRRGRHRQRSRALDGFVGGRSAPPKASVLGPADAARRRSGDGHRLPGRARRRTRRRPISSTGCATT